jgi:hypothetical protein
VWAVGYYWAYDFDQQTNRYTNGKFETLVMRWDGRVWSQVPSPDVEGSSTQHAPGLEITTPFDNELHAVSALPSGEIWAVGLTRASGPRTDPLVLHYTPAPCPNP